MKLYFAPLEGITTYTYRSVHAEMFGAADSYFAPFITPTRDEKVGTRSFRDILPENNCGIKLTPQLLGNDSDAFLQFLGKLKDLGYKSVNLNLGCPSSTVTKKGRGAGALRDLDALDQFFDEVFEKADLDISVKTRIGFFDAEEFEGILKVYNRYPITELIVHPRCREQYYNGTPDMAAFALSHRLAKAPLCYNGDIFSKTDFDRFCGEFPGVDGVMLGRGAIKNPAIFREIRGGERLKTSELLAFHDRLSERYMEVLKSEVYTLHKLKEIWMYIMWNFPDEKKLLKAVKKANSLLDLSRAVSYLPEL